MLKSFRELSRIDTFLERYQYLRIAGRVGEETFGLYRHLNQEFYSSTVWKNFRRDMIIRDYGCDLGIKDRSIQGPIILHHINPLDVDQVLKNVELMLDPNNVICTSLITHKAIHFGDETLLPINYVERKPNDTIPWRV